MAMKVLIYSHSFAPRIGGVETVVMSLATGLAQLNSGSRPPAVTVVTPTAKEEFDDVSLPFRVVRQPSLRQLLRLIRSADVLHVAGPCILPTIIGVLLGRPVVVEHHGFQAICPNGQLLHEPTQALCSGHFMAGRHVDCIRCNANTGSLRSLKSWLLTFPRRWLCTRIQSNIMPTNWLGTLLQLPRSTTVYHGLSKNGATRPAALFPKHSSFAFVGRLVSTKGVWTLLQAARQLRDEGFQFSVMLIGDGPEHERLQEQVIASGLEKFVQFMGYQASDGLQQLLSQAATVVMPSLAGEVFGMVAAENMARGKLMIVSDVGAIREVVRDTGLSFAAGDPMALAACMKSVLQDASLAAQLGARARVRALEQFDENKMVLQHLQLYRQATLCGH